jgi:hypothetical protein
MSTVSKFKRLGMQLHQNFTHPKEKHKLTTMPFPFPISRAPSIHVDRYIYQSPVREKYKENSEITPIPLVYPVSHCVRTPKQCSQVQVKLDSQNRSVTLAQSAQVIKEPIITHYSLSFQVPRPLPLHQTFLRVRSQ